MWFVLSKWFWALFNPGAVLAAGLGLGLLASWAPWRRPRRLGRGLLAVSVLAVVAVAVLPMDTWLLAPLERRFQLPDPMPRAVDGIVLLGGSIDLKTSVARGAPELNRHGDRLLAFAALARAYPRARLVFTGGSGLRSERRYAEADFVPAALAAMGVDTSRVIFERESRTTRENAVRAKALVAPRQGETWLLVTSAFHMPRALGAFRRVGWRALPYPVDYMTSGRTSTAVGFEFTSSLSRLTLALHEWIGLIGYRVLGWTDRLYPRPGAAG